MDGKKPKKRVLTLILNVISIILVLASLALLIFMLFFSGNKVKTVFGYSMFNILTASMEDELPQGSLIVIKKTDPEKLSVGDNITFFSDDPSVPADLNGNRIVTHKVVDIIYNGNGELEGFVSRGVNNPIDDPYPVQPANVIGKVIASSPSLGKAYETLSSRGLSFVLTVVPLFVIVVIAFLDFMAALRRVKEEKELKKKAEEYLENLNTEGK